MSDAFPIHEKHFILATIAAFSHLNPLLQLALSTLELTPSLVISFLLHTNHLPGAQEMVDGRSEDGLCDDVKEFLDKQKEGSVIFVSFGTMRDPGHNCLVLLKAVFVYAAGSQSETFSEELKELFSRMLRNLVLVSRGTG